MNQCWQLCVKQGVLWVWKKGIPNVGEVAAYEIIKKKTVEISEIRSISVKQLSCDSLGEAGVCNIAVQQVGFFFPLLSFGQMWKGQWVGWDT